MNNNDRKEIINERYSQNCDMPQFCENKTSRFVLSALLKLKLIIDNNNHMLNFFIHKYCTSRQDNIVMEKISSQKGKDLLLNEGYRYRKARVNADGSTS